MALHDLARAGLPRCADTQVNYFGLGPDTELADHAQYRPST
jgi:hypothetical protein